MSNSFLSVTYFCYNININGDQLFDECWNSNSILSKFSSEERNLKSSEKWCKLFSLIDIPYILKIVETVLAIPIGNDFVERIFSILHNLWSDERNRLSVKMVKAEICTKVNYSMTLKISLQIILNLLTLLNLLINILSSKLFSCIKTFHNKNKISDFKHKGYPL
jgi:hypothetical protein